MICVGGISSKILGVEVILRMQLTKRLVPQGKGISFWIIEVQEVTGRIDFDIPHQCLHPLAFGAPSCAIAS